jgi:murein DD-endopeptidase MepM/ murein hydrolase activator NlpD
VFGCVLFAAGYWPIIDHFRSIGGGDGGSVDISEYGFVAGCSGEFSLLEPVVDLRFAEIYKKLLPSVVEDMTDGPSDLVALLSPSSAIPVETVDVVGDVDDAGQVAAVSSPAKVTTVYLAKTVQKGDFAGAKVAAGKIKSNFYVDARNAGIPAAVVDSVIKNLSAKVDFRRSLHPGDAFEIMYDAKNRLVCSKITTKRREFSVYSYPSGSGSSYFLANGEKAIQPAISNNSATFGPPLLGKLSISDGFGRRLHPITRRPHDHAGVDFRAQVGTPIIAIYDGVVTRASYYGGYGYCVDLDHPNGYSSRYAHLSRINVRHGQKVRKGQVLALSGSSGLVTGAHCHVELARNKVVIDPFSVKMMPVKKTEPARVANAAAFQSHVNMVNGAMREAR